MPDNMTPVTLKITFEGNYRTKLFVHSHMTIVTFDKQDDIEGIFHTDLEKKHISEKKVKMILQIIK